MRRYLARLRGGMQRNRFCFCLTIFLLVALGNGLAHAQNYPGAIGHVLDSAGQVRAHPRKDE